MIGPGINLTIQIGFGYPQPAPLAIMEALESVSITTTDHGQAGFQLQFHADRSTGSSADFTLVADSLLKPGNRVIAVVTMGGGSTVLLDGLITTRELSHNKSAGASTFTVSGKDISEAMNLVELPFEYPAMNDALIVAFVLAKYTLLGVLPEIIPPLAGMVPLPLDEISQQNTTDLTYLNQLAQAHGNVFYVKPGPKPMMNTAYWGPPLRLGIPQKVLSVDMGSETNVESINFTYDPLQANTVYGMVQDTQLETDLPVVTLTSLHLPPLAAESPLGFNLFQRRELFTDPRLGIIDALIKAQSITNASTDNVLTASGEVDTLRYGAVLTAPGLVQVRGAGFSHDGLYYVQGVTHTISRGSYRQSFNLTREGLGSTIGSVLP